MENCVNCVNCVISNNAQNEFDIEVIRSNGWLTCGPSFNSLYSPPDLKLKWGASPIYFKDKKHAYEDCSELALDRELDVANRTTEWHICEYSISNGGLVCERIYDSNEEYCAKHNRECQYYQCKNRERINNESYCSFHAKKCERCQTRQWINSEGYCSEHQYKCGTCEIRTNKEYCSQHTYKCYVNNQYFWYHSFSCSERVGESNRYCSNHYRACENFTLRNCPNRIPYSQSLCNLCQNSDLCLKGCGARITKYTLYCSNCQEKKELKSLVKQRTSITGNIEEVERFKTWWSKNNIATIITEINNSYWVFLGVIDRKPNSYGRVENNEIFVFPTNPHDTKWGIYSRKQHNSLSAAQSEASWLRTKLNGDNPILVIHPQANNYTSFSSIVTKPYVREEKLPWNLKNHQTDDYLRFGDILKISRVSYYHFAIYLGKGWICNYQNDTGAIFDTYENFLTDGGGISASSGSSSSSSSSSSSNSASSNASSAQASPGYSIQVASSYLIHLNMPFKNYEEIKKHLAKAINQKMGKIGNSSHEYCLASANCENFAFGEICGFWFSQQADYKSDSVVKACPRINNKLKIGLKFVFFDDTSSHYGCKANGGRKSILLKEEIRETNKLFDSLTSSNCDYEKGRIEEYKCEILSPLKISDCVIM